ncbi:Heat shock factor binding 1 [Carpediemonas membranifera]|uniref:Heat shock factor binding 1 n=1 Tax=Carpediemonas membranifera TaxID=201153 RepID=A0A8J6E183_9EUKA|nr:Heat shock factor binding 1 [Carpediemonas membranifera]|eukprot:KAG9392756.1 Heat shock factor binding 1 [Carpediemonas membranifera]
MSGADYASKRSFLPFSPKMDQTPQDLSNFVANVLNQMQEQFQNTSQSILQKIDSMGARIQDLEGAVAELVDQANVNPEEDK